MEDQKHRPLVSVIIPVYNYEKYVQEAIVSAIHQTYSNLELLILDDGSKDLTYDKICEMEGRCRKRFVRFEFIKQENRGIHDTLNRLIDMTAGEYIFRLDADDIAVPHAIETELGFLENNPDYVLCVGGNDVIDENSNRCFLRKWDENIYNHRKAKFFSHTRFKRMCPPEFSPKDFGTYYYLLYFRFHVPNGYLIRKSIFNKIGSFIKDAPVEDYWMALQISKYAKVKYLSDTFLFYRSHGTNTVKTVGYFQRGYKTLLYELRTAFPEIEEFRNEEYDRIPETIEENRKIQKHLRDIFHTVWYNNPLNQKSYNFALNTVPAVSYEKIKNKRKLEYNNKTGPLVSVILPVYNREKYIQETILSIINQTYDNLELLIVDDGSKDSTYDKICELESRCGKRFVRFDIVRQKNLGIHDTLNSLIGMSAGEYIFRIDSDDIIVSHAIEAEIDFLTNNPDYGLCVGNNDIIDKNSRRCFWNRSRNTVYDAKNAFYFSFSGSLMQDLPNLDFYSDDFGSYYNLVYYGNHIPNGYLMRKSIFEKMGPFIKEAPLEDYWMVMQFAKYSKLKILRDTLYFYRWHTNNTISNINRYDLTYKTLLYELRATFPEIEEFNKYDVKNELRQDKFETTMKKIRDIFHNYCKNKT
jgi:alpha-1,3-rhamnosyltransferase